MRFRDNHRRFVGAALMASVLMTSVTMQADAQGGVSAAKAPIRKLPIPKPASDKLIQDLTIQGAEQAKIAQGETPGQANWVIRQQESNRASANDLVYRVRQGTKNSAYLAPQSSRLDAAAAERFSYKPSGDSQVKITGQLIPAVVKEKKYQPTIGETRLVGACSFLVAVEGKQVPVQALLLNAQVQPVEGGLAQSVLVFQYLKPDGSVDTQAPWYCSMSQLDTRSADSSPLKQQLQDKPAGVLKDTDGNPYAVGVKVESSLEVLLIAGLAAGALWYATR